MRVHSEQIGANEVSCDEAKATVHSLCSESAERWENMCNNRGGVSRMGMIAVDALLPRPCTEQRQMDFKRANDHSKLQRQ